MTDRQKPFLLTVGGYFGTLAAARSLGRVGITVNLADSDPSSPTAHSQYIKNFYQAPSLSNLEKFGQFLLDFGKKNPGMILYPTSDDLAWIIARMQKDLGNHYALYQPQESSIFNLLNKERLYKLAIKHGLETPNTIYINSFDDLEKVKSQIEFPVIVKPKTQIGMLVNVKGLISNTFHELEYNIRQFLERFRYKDEMIQYDPSLAWPMIQKFMPEASGETYSLSGFIWDKKPRIVVRAAQKVLQQPIKIGVGLAFESRPINQILKEKILGLAREIGYFGVFEAEFIHVSQTNQYLLMDFNPRFYGQMGFDIKRNLPLAYLVFLAASGKVDELERQLDQAETWDHEIIYKYRFGWMMKVLLTTQWIGGQIEKEKRAKWLKWAQDKRCYDAIEDANDLGPHKTYVRNMLYRMLRHPRSSIKHYFY